MQATGTLDVAYSKDISSNGDVTEHPVTVGAIHIVSYGFDPPK